MQVAVTDEALQHIQLLGDLALFGREPLLHNILYNPRKRCQKASWVFVCGKVRTQ